jgi:hypothetical protein
LLPIRFSDTLHITNPKNGLRTFRLLASHQGDASGLSKGLSSLR